MSFGEVQSTLDWKRMIGPPKDILEVQNAYNAYEQLGRFDPFSVADVHRAHRILMEGILSDAGSLRRKAEGVFRDDACIFMAPPPGLVPQLMDNLFDWLLRTKDTLPALIQSSVVHYEFVFIHPFRDENGRMARLGQTALLSEWSEVFEALPIENEILRTQAQYYEAIAASHSAGSSGPFILFMLERIMDAIRRLSVQLDSEASGSSGEVQRLLEVMKPGVPYTAGQLLALLGLKSRSSFRGHYLCPALDEGLIRRTLPDKPTSRNQRYILSSRP